MANTKKKRIYKPRKKTTTKKAGAGKIKKAEQLERYALIYTDHHCYMKTFDEIAEERAVSRETVRVALKYWRDKKETPFETMPGMEQEKRASIERHRLRLRLYDKKFEEYEEGYEETRVTKRKGKVWNPKLNKVEDIESEETTTTNKRLVSQEIATLKLVEDSEKEYARKMGFGDDKLKVDLLVEDPASYLTRLANKGKESEDSK